MGCVASLPQGECVIYYMVGELFRAMVGALRLPTLQMSDQKT